MKNSKFLFRILFSPLFLAIFPSVIAIFFLPPISEKYMLDAVRFPGKPFQLVYNDLNGDSISELLRLDEGFPYNPLAILDNNQNYYDQWNVTDSLVTDISNIVVGNYNHDKYSEIYLFTVHGDSLFLNVNEFFNPHGLHLQHLYITKVTRVKGVYTTKLYTAGFFDEDGDGNDEIYFTLVTGFGLEPRRLCSYDLVNKKLKTSEFTGFICMYPQMADIDGDNRPEIFGMTSASGNYKIKSPYPDYSNWLMVFDDQLKFKFKPIEFKGFASGLFTLPFRKANERYIVSLFNTNTANNVSLKAKIMLFTPSGQLIKSKLLEEIGTGPNPLLAVIHQKNEDKIILVSSSILILNSKLELLKKISLPFNSYLVYSSADIFGDGENEIFLYSSEEQKLAIYNSTFNKLYEKNIQLPTGNWNTSIQTDRTKQRKLCITSQGEHYLLNLSLNKYYLLGFLVYPGIYIILFLFILLIRNITVYQISQRENLKRRLINLQLQSIKSQLDPHFTFNALNSIAALIYEDDRQTAYDHMNKFTQLLRRMLNDADKIYRSLRDELEFVKTYLDLEKLRFGDKFIYQIEIGPGINENEQVPKMVLQTFAENAIKHGILPRPTGGKLVIRAEKEIDILKLTIEDNGIGRVNSSGQSTSTGKGLKITDEFYEILNQTNKRPIKHVITDLYDQSGLAVGTRVEVWVPVD